MGKAVGIMTVCDDEFVLGVRRSVVREAVNITEGKTIVFVQTADPVRKVPVGYPVFAASYV